MSSSKVGRSVCARVGSEEVRGALDKILSSRHFVNAHKKKAFLRLVCDLYVDGRAGEVNEYRLAFDVFGRDSGYNPATDPIVRVAAHDIRKKLELYYENEGAGDELRLELPHGSYQPVFTRLAAEPEAAAPQTPAEPEAAAEVEPKGALPEETAPESAPERTRETAPEATPKAGLATAPAPRRAVSPAVAAVVAVVLVALGGAGALALQGWRSSASDAGAGTIERSPLWAPFTRDAAPPLVILSNPPVLRLSNASDPPTVLEGAIPLSPEAAEAMKDRFVVTPEVLVREPAGRGATDEPAQPVLKQNRVPSLIYSTNAYTGMGEAIALYHLTNFFRGEDRTLLLKQSRTLGADDLKNHNVVLLGGVWVNEWSAKLADQGDFVFTSNGTVRNRAPREGETAEYVPQFDGPTGNLVVDYALITVKPNLSDAKKVMVLAGVYSQGTEAAAEFVTERNYLDVLHERLRQLGGPDGPPPYFQVLLQVGVENGIPTTITVLAVHPLRPAGA